MKDWLVKNWKTSLAGVLAIAATVISTWLPEYAPQLQKVVAILVGLGFIAAKDGDKSGPAGTV